MAIGMSAVRALALAVLVSCVGLTFSGAAFAGTLQIRDESHVLAAGDADRVRSVVGAAPFDARLVFTSDYASKEELGRFVHTILDEPNMVAVGIDPQHHYVEVRFGRGSGVRRAEWGTIESAGNDAFRASRWADGAASIFRDAARSVDGSAAVPSSSREGAHGVGLGSVLMILLVVGGGVALLGLLARRFTAGPPNGPGYGSPGYGPGYGPPGYGPGGYGPGPYGPQGGGMGPVGGGLIGAGLGGLAGYELGKLEGEHERNDRGYGNDARVVPDDDVDAGGGGSSWDDGGGGGDSGGGFDGGGGDSGGGGSDF
jgi:uncharacterized membrane protein YgcG